MPDQDTLALWPRDHDLPPRWDCQPVEWGDWSDSGPVFICPPPRKPERCTKCRSERLSLINFGRIRDILGALVGHLTVFRCPDCGHDTVRDDHGHMWDLDDTDYTGDGSYDVAAGAR